MTCNEQIQPGEILKDKIVDLISCRLCKKDSIPVAFPPCSDVLLSKEMITEEENKDDITKYFKEYFGHYLNYMSIEKDLKEIKSTALPPKDKNKKKEEIESKLNIHLRNLFENADKIEKITMRKELFQIYSQSCLPRSYIELKGNRNLSDNVKKDEDNRIRRLFIADLIWLFYFERMGIYKILGVILDDFATKGKFPMANNEDSALILESMVRQTKTGLSSTVRDRDSSYRRCLGWTSETGRKLEYSPVINTAFNSLFLKFVQSALEYYKYKRLTEVIERTAPPSAATIVSISNTIEVLKKSFRPFDYGRNYSNTLSGIVWAIATMSIIRDIRTTIGIPNNYESPDQYIPAAYDILVMGRTITPSEANRYIIHKECAEYARDVLLDLEVLDHTKSGKDQELQIWLDSVESKIEGYRSAYRNLTGVDLGIPPAPGTPKIEQAV